MISDVVQSVSAPHTVSALKQLVLGNVNLLVHPAVILTISHVVALLARYSLILLGLVSPGPTVEIHLPCVVTLVGAILANLQSLSLTVSCDLVC